MKTEKINEIEKNQNYLCQRCVRRHSLKICKIISETDKLVQELILILLQIVDQKRSIENGKKLNVKQDTEFSLTMNLHCHIKYQEQDSDGFRREENQQLEEEFRKGLEMELMR